MTRFASALLLLILLAACAPAPVPSPTVMPPAPTAAPPAPEPSPTVPPPTSTPAQAPSVPATLVDGTRVTLYVDPAITHQTLRDVTGGNFIHVFSGTTDPNEPVSRYNLDHLPVRVARLRMALESWEPVNDDADPAAFHWEAYQDTGHNHAAFLLLQELQARGAQLVVSAWNLPDWLVADPAKDSKRFVPYENYPELVEIVASWLVYARDRYGVEPQYVSFNEPDIGANVGLAAFEMVMLIEQAGKRFDELGIKTKWLIADTANIAGSTSYARSLLEKSEIRPYLGVLANHSWDSSGPESTYTTVRDFALANGLEVWCTELGFDPFAWLRPEEFPTYDYALKLARIYTRVLKLTGASTVLYWEMMGQDYWINNGADPYPSFHVIRQLGEQFPPGSVIVETSNNTATLYTVAAQAPEHFAVFLVNSGETALTVTLQGLPPGDYTQYQSAEDELETRIAAFSVPEQTVSLTLPAMSIHVLTTRAP